MKRPALLAGGILLCLGATLVGVGAWHRRGEDRLASTGAVADAVVIARESTSVSPEQRGDYFVRYRFSTTDGRSFEGRARIDRRRWTAYVEGMRIPVAYRPDDPSLNRLPAARGTPTSELLWMSGGAFLLAGSGIVGFSAVERRRRRARRALVVHRRVARR